MPLLSRLYSLQSASPLAALSQPPPESQLQRTPEGLYYPPPRPGRPERAPLIYPITMPDGSLRVPGQEPQMGPEWQMQSALPTPPASTLNQGAVAQGPAKQSTPFDQNAPQFQAPGRFGQIMQGLGSLDTNPLFSLGMSLMGNAQGSNWAGVGQDVRAFGQAQRERQMIDNEQRRQKAGDVRAETQFGWMQTEHQRSQEQRQAWEAAINGSPADQQAQLRAMGPDNYAQYMTALETRRFQAEQSELDRRNALNVAGMRLTGANRPEGASQYWQRPSGRDQMMLQDYEGAVQNGRAALIGLDRLERLFGEMIQRDAQGRPLPASMRMSMSRLMQTNPESRAAYEQIQSQVWPLVLQNLEGLAPVTEVELGQALARTVNADMTPEAALSEIRRMRMESQRAVDLGLRAFDFSNEAGSLNTGRNSAGQNWIEFSGGAFDEARQRANEDQQTDRAPSAPRVGDVRGGYRYTGGDPSLRSSWVRVDGPAQSQERTRRDGAFRTNNGQIFR